MSAALKLKTTTSGCQMCAAPPLSPPVDPPPGCGGTTSSSTPLTGSATAPEASGARRGAAVSGCTSMSSKSCSISPFVAAARAAATATTAASRSGPAHSAVRTYSYSCPRWVGSSYRRKVPLRKYSAVAPPPCALDIGDASNAAPAWYSVS